MQPFNLKVFIDDAFVLRFSRVSFISGCGIKFCNILVSDLQLVDFIVCESESGKDIGSNSKLYVSVFRPFLLQLQLTL